MSATDISDLASPVDLERYGAYEVPHRPGDPRPLLRFAGRISTDGSGPFLAEAGRYHLYGEWSCPFSQRVLLTRALAGLEATVSASYVDGRRDGRGWAFRGRTGPDPINGFQLLREAYEASEPGFDGHVSVPVLWDRSEGCIVSNDPRTIEVDLATRFGAVAKDPVDLYPPGRREEIDEIDSWLAPIFAQAPARPTASDGDPERARCAVLDALDALDIHLQDRRYLTGDAITLADVRLFVSLVRFDTGPNADRSLVPGLEEYDDLWAYARDLYAEPAFASTTDLGAFARPGAPVDAWSTPAVGRDLLGRGAPR